MLNRIFLIAGVMIIAAAVWLLIFDAIAKEAQFNKAIWDARCERHPGAVYCTGE